MAFGRREQRQAGRHRRLVRLAGYDYSQTGAYFVTVCTQDQACLFGVVTEDGALCWNDAGQMVIAQWEALADRFPGVEIDALVVMPNHVHGIVWICDGKPTPRANANRATTRVAPTGVQHGGAVGAGLVPARPNQDGRPALGDVVGAFKSVTTVAYTRGVKASGWPGFRGRLWRQRN